MIKKKGLTQQEVESARSQFGSNQLSQKETESFLQKYLGNFQDPIIRILLVALVINVTFMFFGQSEWYESLGIFIAVLLATFISTYSEFRNESAFQKLQDEASKIKCKAYRNGSVVEIPIDDIVVGDCIVLQSGDKIPADGILIEGSIKVDQSTLNGESKEATKKVMPEDYVDNADKIDFLNEYKLFRGSVICSGEGVLDVTSVGDKTVYGSITQELQVEERDSPLKVKLSKLAAGISKFGYIGGIGIAIVFMVQKIIIENHFESAAMLAYATDLGKVLPDLVQAVILAVVIIVMAVPEGLPLMIAIVSSLNMRKMLADNVLVRKIAGIETAGSLNILFSDKTGTITKGQLEVVTFITGNNDEYKNYNEIHDELKKLFHLSAVENSGALISNDKGTRKIIGGNATERAILGFITTDSNSEYSVEKVSTLPFNSTAKYSATSVEGDYNLTLIKGAPEKIISQCKYYYDVDGTRKELTDTSALENKMQQLAERAIRVIALAATKESLEEDKLPGGDFTLVGIVGIRDEVRPEAIGAIEEVGRAGVQVVMITGDRKETAVAIAREAGLLKSSDDIVLTSDEVQILTDDELKKMLPQIRVIARALPSDKSRLVRIAQECNLVVGMTGDGVNDSPALKRADVGFAMGNGTEVAKEAGDIVILDDNFKSIEQAILYGRTIYNSIRKFIIFQLTINVSAVCISFLGPLFDVRPLDITQMLWINLVMDTLAAIAFGGEPALKKYMSEKPKTRDENIVSKQMWSAILINGGYITILSVLFLFTPIISQFFRADEKHLYLYTGYFTFFVLACMFNGFSVRAEGLNLFANIGKNQNFLKIMGIITLIQVIITYIGGAILRTAGLNGTEWVVVVIMAISIIPIDMIRKVLSGSGIKG